MQPDINDTSSFNISLREVPILPPTASQSLPLPIPASHEGDHQHVRSRKPRNERKAACTACRQQKLKCDAYLDPENPCSRCRKLCLRCFRLAGFQRLEVRKARQSKSIPNEGGSKENSADQVHQHASSSTASGTSPGTSRGYRTVRRGSYFIDSTDSNVLHPQASNPPSLTVPSSVHAPAQSRRLSDIDVDGKIIDECFQIFFSKYSSLLPVFPSRLIPNECYNRSLTLFWAIVVVGSRSLISDPTLLHGLAGEVLNLALTSFQAMRNLIDDIKGLLLLCTWPCPSTTILRDNTVAISGLLLNLSMQAGLHAPNTPFAQLSRDRGENHSSRRLELATLWVHVVITCDSVMSLGGYAISSGTIACCSFEKTAWQLVPKLLQWRYRTQRILSEAQSAIVELGLDTGTMHKQSCILPRIKTLKSKFDNLKVELSCVQGSQLDTIYAQSAHLQLEVLQLYGIAELNDISSLLELFRAASGLILAVKELNDTTDIASYSPMYLSTSFTLAAFTLLRMMKSRFIHSVDESVKQEGKSRLFMAILTLRQISLVNNDVYAKSAEMLSIMWRNPAFFKSSNPSSFWTLRIRNRLTMSVVFDTVSIWIEDYGYCNAGAAPPVQPSSGDRSQRRVWNAVEPVCTPSGTDSAAEEPAVLQSIVGSAETNDALALPSDDRWLYELDWNASLDVLLTE